MEQAPVPGPSFQGLVLEPLPQFPSLTLQKALWSTIGLVGQGLVELSQEGAEDRQAMALTTEEWRECLVLIPVGTCFREHRAGGQL